MVKINWNGFIEKCIKAQPNELVADIFTNAPYQKDEIWEIIQLKSKCTITKVKKHTEYKQGVYEDMSDYNRLKKDKTGWTKIGNIHSHPLDEDYSVNEGNKMSDIDLKSAQEEYEIISGIVYFMKEENEPRVLFFDMFGKKLKIDLEVEDNGK